MAYKKSRGRLLGDLFGKASIFSRQSDDSIKIDTDSSGVVSSSTTVANTEFQSFVANTNTLIATKVDSSSLADVATSGSYSDLTGSPIATGDSTPKVTFSQNEPASIDAIGEVWYDTNNGSWYISVDSGIVSPVGPSSIDTTNTTSWVGFNNNNDGNLTFPYNASGNITITFNTPLWLNYFKGEAGGNHHGIITRVYYEDGTDVAGPAAPPYAGGHTITSTNSLFTYGRVTRLDLYTYSGQGWNGKSTLRAAGAPIWQEVSAAFSGSYNDLTDTPTIPSTTGLATETYVDTAVSNIVNTAPTTLNTLNELAAALNDDANFATTVTTSLAGKAANSYVNSTFVSNTAFQSFVANTNSAFSNYWPSANVISYVAAAAGGGATVVVSDTAPSSPSEGDLWFNSTTLKTFIYYSSSWVQTNPAATATGVSNTAFQSFVANTNAYIADVAVNAGEVSNAYLTSTYTTNTAFQSFVANTNAYIAATAGVSNTAFQSFVANTNAAIANAGGGLLWDGVTNFYSDTTPSIDTNPSANGALWVNSTTGAVYICTDNTTDLNVWKVTSSLADTIQFVGLTGENYGYASGGIHPSFAPSNYMTTNRIQKFSFATDGNSTDVGDLVGTGGGRAFWHAGQSSKEYGYASGGRYTSTDSASMNEIKKFPFAVDANATDVGDLATALHAATGLSSETDGWFAGGYAYPSYKSSIQRFPFASDTNATDIGSGLNAAQGYAAGHSSQEYGYVSGGRANSATNFYEQIRKFPWATPSGTTTTVGNLNVGTGHGRVYHSGSFSHTHGYAAGGNVTPNTSTNIIDKFPFASDTSATDVADLGSGGNVGNSSTTHGYSSTSTVIHKYSHVSDSNSTSVGNMLDSGGARAGHHY